MDLPKQLWNCTNPSSRPTTTWFCSPLCRTRVGQHLVFPNNQQTWQMRLWRKRTKDGKSKLCEKSTIILETSPSLQNLSSWNIFLKISKKIRQVFCGVGDKESSKKSHYARRQFPRHGRPRPCAAWNSVLPSTASDAVSTSAGHWTPRRMREMRQEWRRQKWKLNLTGGCHQE